MKIWPICVCVCVKATRNCEAMQIGNPKYCKSIRIGRHVVLEITIA